MHRKGKVAKDEFSHRRKTLIIVSENNSPDFDTLTEQCEIVQSLYRLSKTSWDSDNVVMLGISIRV